MSGFNAHFFLSRVIWVIRKLINEEEMEQQGQQHVTVTGRIWRVWVRRKYNIL